MALEVVILAAGQGKRMRSTQPKVLQPLAGQPLLAHVLKAAKALEASSIRVVVGHGRESIESSFENQDIQWVEQKEQLGTGHAVFQALEPSDENARVLILYGDVPLIEPETLKQLLASTPNDAVGILTAHMEHPEGLGRIIRDPSGDVARIIEQKDASPEERRIQEVNTGILVAPAVALHAWLNAIEPKNAQGEYYLTDVIQLAVSEGIPVIATELHDPIEAMGVNTKSQLSQLERAYQYRMALGYEENGVHFMDPTRVDFRGETCFGDDVVVDINVIFEGKVTIGSGCKIGPGVILKDVELAENVEIKAYSVLEGARIGEGAAVGPFARVRPGTHLHPGGKIGNFVETKKAVIGSGSKVNHLSYIGDATIGTDVNIGAGTITCNFDGANKYQTIIEDRAFIGSGTQLVAPVVVGESATIGAGTTLTSDAPKDTLVVGRARQREVKSWNRPQKA